MKKLKIDIAVGGRFHADQMALALKRLGHEVRLLTSYPKSRFPYLNSSEIETHLMPEFLYRGFRAAGFERAGERAKMLSFGSWVDKRVDWRTPDVLIVWSSFGKEALARKTGTRKVLIRDSTHFLHQADVLIQENERMGLRYVPDALCAERELAEYETADQILVLSDFAKHTFVARGIAPERISVIPLGVNSSLFTPGPSRKLKLPLKAIYFGTLSLRKGTHLLLEATKMIDPKLVQTYLVGPVERGFEPILKRYTHAHVTGPLPHSQLAPFLWDKDLYLFPSLEDGFPNTLIQAMAAGLVPITTDMCGPAELMQQGVHGIKIPAGSSRAIEKALLTATANLELLTDMRARCLKLAQQNTWTRYGDQVRAWLTESEEKTKVKPLPKSPAKASASKAAPEPSVRVNQP